MTVNAKLAQGGAAQHPLIYQPAKTVKLADGSEVPAAPLTALTDGEGNVLKVTDNGDGTFTIPFSASVADLAPTASAYLASAARTTTQTGADQTNTLGFKGFHLITDVTAGTAGFSITPKVQAKDGNGIYYDVIVGAAITATGTNVLKLFPGATPQANAVADDQLPLTYRIVITVADAKSVTYSVGLNLLP